MIDAEKILRDLKRQAEEITRDFDVDAKVDEAKEAAGKVRERLETDPQARTAAAGAGGLLLLGLLGTKGGRNLVGNIAKTGAVAALGALAYKAWNDRKGASPSSEQSDTPPAEFLDGANDDPYFALAVARAMFAAAYADGEIDQREHELVANAIVEVGGNDETLGLLMDQRDEEAELDRIAEAATTPNRAAQLYAAAAMTVDADNEKNAKFLERLAIRLGIAPDYAEAIKRG